MNLSIKNHLQTETLETFVDDALEKFDSVLETNMDLFGKQENEETYDQQSQHLEETDTDSCDADFREIEN